MCLFISMHDEIPMLRKRVFTEPITIRLKPETKRIRDQLKLENRVDISEIERQALERAYGEIEGRLKGA